MEMCSAFHWSQYFRAYIHRGIVNASAFVVCHHKGNYGKTTPTVCIAVKKMEFHF